MPKFHFNTQWTPDIHWTSNGRLYEVRTSYRRPLHVQRTSGAHWVKLQSNVIETTLRYECSPVNLLHIFGTSFP